MELDDMFQLLGHFGRFQAFYFTILLFPVIMSGFRGTEYIFTTMNIPHRCRIPECEGNGSVQFSPPWLVDAVPLDSNHDPQPCQRYRSRVDLNSSSSSSTTCLPQSFQRDATEGCDEWVFSEPATTIAYDDKGQKK